MSTKIVIAVVVVVAGCAAVWWVSRAGIDAQNLRLIETPQDALSPLAGRERDRSEMLPPPPDPNAAGVVPTPVIAYEAAFPPAPPPEPTLSADRLRLGELATNYVYRSLAQVGQVRTGKLEDTRQPSLEKIISVTEGAFVEEDMYVERLTPRACVMALGDATYELRLIGIEFEQLLKELQTDPRELTDAEKQLATDRYMALWGNKMKEYSLRNPRQTVRPQLTEAEQAANRVRYWEKYGEQMREQFEQYKESLGEDADLYPALRSFDGLTEEEQRRGLEDYLDAVEKEYDMDISPEKREELRSRLIRKRVPADPSRWETPYAGFAPAPTPAP